MKKSLINIITLAVSVANMVLMVVLVFAIVPAMNNTNNLITKICSAIELELSNSTGFISTDNIPIQDLAIYDLSEELRAGLKNDAAGKPHYMMFKVTISMNSKHEDYSTYGTAEAMLEREGLIRSRIFRIVSDYTIEEAQGNIAALEEATLASLKQLYNGSDFIIDVSFTDYIFQ